MGERAVDSYGLDPAFEKSVAALCASSPKFFGSVGHAIDPDALNNESARLIVKVAATIFKEAGRGPAHPSILMQRLRRLNMEGSITVKQINGVLDLLIEAPVLEEPDVVAEIAPVLRRRMHAEVVRSSMDEYNKRTDFEQVVAKIDKARRVGVQDASLGLRLGNDSFTEIDRIRRIHKLPLGIPELDAVLGGGVPRGTQTLFIAGQGGGKCHAKGQGILMHDGTVRKVEEIKVGDKLAGPSGKRTVRSLARGKAQMYDVIPTKGKPWRVNGDHILTLVHSSTGTVSDVPVLEYLSWSAKRQAQSMLIRSPAEFALRTKPLPLDPYVLGVILGDGSTTDNSLMVTSADPEIADALAGYVAEMGMRLTVRAVRGKALSYGLAGSSLGRYGKNPICEGLEALNLRRVACGEKFVPHAYKTAEPWVRREVLAGLIDTDGHHNGRGGFDYISKSPQLADDVTFIARSIGLAAYVTQVRKGCQTGVVGTYYRVCISGHTAMVPCRISRKKAPPRLQKKDALRTGFVVKKAGVENYYGFNLDGDRRYLLDDFTVTHNSMQMSHTIARNLSYGMFCGYATLELPETEVVARVKANLTGVPTSVIAAGDFSAARAELEKMYPTLGTLLVQRFSPKHTTFADIRAWIKECEDSEGFAMDLIAIDYIDKLKGRNIKDNEYITQGEQAEEFRVFVEDHGKWGLTGSQATMKGRDTRKRIGIADVRDSSRKVDVADQVVTLTKSADGDMITYFVGKNRYGPGEVEVGPIPHDWERGRMVVL